MVLSCFVQKRNMRPILVAVKKSRTNDVLNHQNLFSLVFRAIFKSLDEGFSTFSMVRACLNPPPCIKGVFFSPPQRSWFPNRITGKFSHVRRISQGQVFFPGVWVCFRDFILILIFLAALSANLHCGKTLGLEKSFEHGKIFQLYGWETRTFEEGKKKHL